MGKGRGKLEKPVDKTGAESEKAMQENIVAQEGLELIEAAKNLPKAARYIGAVNTKAALRQLIDVRNAIDESVKDYLKENVHYGAMPGSSKQILLQPGAVALANLFNLKMVFPDPTRIDHPGDHREFICKCVIYTREGDLEIASAMGSCSTMESKYAFRTAELSCPYCSQPLRRSKIDGGWYCWAKKGGCGEKFKEDDPFIAAQPRGKVPNPCLADTYNTVLKMAEKRAMVGAVLRALGCSDRFTQDEDFLLDKQPYADDSDYREPEPEDGRQERRPGAKTSGQKAGAQLSASSKSRPKAEPAKPRPKAETRTLDELLAKLDLPKESFDAVSEYLVLLARQFASQNFTVEDLINRAWLNPDSFKAKFNDFVKGRAQAAESRAKPESVPEADRAQEAGLEASQIKESVEAEMASQAEAPPKDLDPDEIKDWCLGHNVDLASCAEEYTATPIHNWDASMWSDFAAFVGMI